MTEERYQLESRNLLNLLYTLAEDQARKGRPCVRRGLLSTPLVFVLTCVCVCIVGSV